MAAQEETELKELFDKAANYLRTIAGTFDGDKLLYFYARFKQAKEGPCNVPRPGFFDFQGKQKWDAWKNLEDKSGKDAMEEYVKELERIDPDWQDKAEDGQGQGGLGIGVSTMANPDDELEDEQKTAFDWCKEGDIKQLRKMLSGSEDINRKDSEGLALLHWACDRGLDNMVTFLLENKADINVQDIDGQTPLHYAASCEHIPVIQTLLKHRADVSIQDNDGLTPAEATENKHIINMLQKG